MNKEISFLFNDLQVVINTIFKIKHQQWRHLHTETKFSSCWSGSHFVSKYSVFTRNSKTVGQVLVILIAVFEHDIYKCVVDLQESMFEMNQIIEAEKSLKNK